MVSDFTWRRLFKLVADGRDDMPSSDAPDALFPNVDPRGLGTGYDRFQLQPFPVNTLIDQESTAQGRDIV